MEGHRTDAPIDDARLLHRARRAHAHEHPAIDDGVRVLGPQRHLEGAHELALTAPGDQVADQHSVIAQRRGALVFGGIIEDRHHAQLGAGAGADLHVGAEHAIGGERIGGEGLALLDVPDHHHGVAGHAGGVADDGPGRVAHHVAQRLDPRPARPRITCQQSVQLGEQLAVGGGRAQVQAVLARLDAAHRRDLRDIDQHVWILHIPVVDADRRVAHQQLDLGGVAVTPDDLAHLGERQGAIPAVSPFAVMERARRAAERGREIGRHRGGVSGALGGVHQRVQAALLVVGTPAGGEVLHPVEDGPVSGAAAQVAVEDLLDLALVGRTLAAAGALRQHGVHVHHEARRAIAALGADVPGNAVLHRAQLRAGGAGALRRGDGLAVEGTERAQARVHRVEARLAPRRVPFGEHHRAGAAAALRAHLLGAGEADGGGAQPVEQQGGGVGVVDHHLLAVQVEPQIGDRRTTGGVGRVGAGAHGHSPVTSPRRRAAPRASRRRDRCAPPAGSCRPRIAGTPPAPAATSRAGWRRR